MIQKWATAIYFCVLKLDLIDSGQALARFSLVRYCPSPNQLVTATYKHSCK